MAEAQSDSAPSEPPSASLAPNESIDAAIRHLIEGLDAQFVSLLDRTRCEALRCRTFSRFIVADAALTFDLWRPGDDVDLYFVTDDNANRWAQVATEAVGVEVGDKELKEATRDGTLDLTDDRVCHFRNGNRTQYWYLQHANPARCRVLLHYIKLPNHVMDAATFVWHVRDRTTGTRDDPVPLFEHKPTAHEQNFNTLFRVYCADVAASVQTVWPPVRAWAESNDLWTPTGPVDANALFRALSVRLTLGWFEDSSADAALLMALRGFASRDIPDHTPHGISNALAAAAELSLRDPDATAHAVRAAQAARAPSLLHSPAPPPGTQGTQESRKFRPAHSALNRLRFDPAHADTAYDVGYLDRFEGLKWVPLAQWGGRGTEEEDFVPEHRVRRIVRVVDGWVVWEREGRVDRTGEV